MFTSQPTLPATIHTHTHNFSVLSLQSLHPPKHSKMINEYSKIKISNTTKPKSRSIDISDLYSPPQTPKPKTNPTPTPTSSQPSKQTNYTTTIMDVVTTTTTATTTNDHPIPSNENEDDGAGERFGVILTRNCSVSSTSSQRFRAEKQQQQQNNNNTALQVAVMRAFSMRRSASVSEGHYCRIHDQSDPFSSSPTTSPHLASFHSTRLSSSSSSSKKKSKKSKILKACRSFFGL